MGPLLRRSVLVFSAGCLLAISSLPAYGQGKLLWQIGNANGSTAELALGPNRYHEYKDDSLYVVGLSDAKRDWSYVLPGPADSWAGGRWHECLVLFALNEKPASACRLVVDLVDTHSSAPPRLSVAINGRMLTTVQMPSGAGDASIAGDPSRGRKHQFAVDVPAEALVQGSNELAIRSTRGSWVLFDAVGFEAPTGVTLGKPATTTSIRQFDAPPLLVEKEGKLLQLVRVAVRHFGEPVKAQVSVAGAAPVEVELANGQPNIEVAVPAVEKETRIAVTVGVGAKTLATQEIILKPVRKWMVYLLPHSHVDIGYTRVQTEVERDHWRYYEQAIEAARRTANYPSGAQFKWNAEVLWATDSYLKQATPEKQQAFLEAVRKGWIGLDALYGNELTALCRPEELVRLVDYAGQVARRAGVKIDSAMISDVPGYTWGLTTVLAESGVKYFCVGPNGGHRIGHTLEAWRDKPFWWLAPTSQKRILVWIPRTGYGGALGSGQQAIDLVRGLEESGYPYEMVQVRYCLGDNAGPGLGLSDLVKDWNAKYAYPRLIIATTSEMMREFERRYGASLPEVRGDFTPYWEDGAASSALETGLNRCAAERLNQAEALWAILQPGTYPADQFYAAWRNVILYDEHTWGAHNSISAPDSEFAKSQWAIKQAFALDGDRQSRQLLAAAVRPVRASGPKVSTLAVFNTSSWSRTDLVLLPAEAQLAGEAVRGPDGQPVPSQRLASGEFAFLAADVPPMGAKRFTLGPGQPGAAPVPAKAEGTALSNGVLELSVDTQSGSITSLKRQGIQEDLVDKALGLNAYRYVAGRNPAQPQSNGQVTIAAKDRGPLVASLVIQSPAPGCRNLVREIRLVAGLDHIDLLNVVDKQKVRTPEGVHFGFALSVPQGTMRMDIPLAVIRPESDQLPGACKNYFTVSRWLDVSGDRYGLSWATIDAPLVEVGRIDVDVPAPFQPSGWIARLEPSQTFYSYVMNNYWETNYKADQEGPTPMRYALRPHTGTFDAVAAARFGLERSQPLVAVPAAENAPAETASRLQVDSPAVIITALKPSRDGKALVVRLFNVTNAAAKATLAWSDPRPSEVRSSDFAEQPGEKLNGPIELPPYGLVTVRGEIGQ